MHCSKGNLLSILLMLCCLLNLPKSYAAYQEMEDDGWSEFNAQMQTAARHSQHKMDAQAAVRPHAPVSPRVIPKQTVAQPQLQPIKTPPKPRVKRPAPPVVKRSARIIPPPVYRQKAVRSVITTPSLYSFVGSISAGPVWESAGQTQTFNLTPSIKKTYSANSQSSLLFNGELFAGVQRVLNPHVQAQLGIALAMTNSADLSGDIWDDAKPEFNNFLYSYSVQHSHVALKGKLLTDSNFYALKPYVSASLGIGFNKAQNFSNVPTIFEAVHTPDFTPTTTTAFTYTLGIGAQRALSSNIYLGLGYEFAAWGNSKLGAAPEQTIGEGLVLDQLYTNGLMLHLSFLG